MVSDVRPTSAVRAELEQYLLTSSGRVPDVFPLRREGLSDVEIASRLGVATARFVWNCNRTIEALLDGDLPSARTLVAGHAAKCRSLIERAGPSSECRQYLQSCIEELSRRHGADAIAPSSSVRSRERLRAAC